MSHTSETLQAAFHYLFPDEVPALKLLAKMLPLNPIVINIGAGAGTSGLAFMESRDDLTLVTIDISKESNPYGCLDAEMVVLQQADLWNSRVQHIQSDSISVGNNWSEYRQNNRISVKADMVFIDGNHSYAGCKGDILAWLPNIKKGGIIAVHDYKKSELFENDKDFHPDKPHPKPWPGVDKAVDELLLNKYETITRVDSLIAFRV